MHHPSKPVPQPAGPVPLRRPIDLHGVALPVADHLLVVAPNGMVVSLLVFLAAATVLQPLMGNLGLWLSLHIWFAARGAYYWVALERKRAGLFA